MTQPSINETPFLITSRRFPKEPEKLILELSKSYIEIANAVNTRSIGLFSTAKPSVNGQSWYINSPDSNPRQQGFTRVYTFTTFAAINHGINIAQIDRFTECYGGYYDGTNWDGLPWTNSTGIAGVTSFYLSPTQIVFTNPSAIVKGQVVLQWIAF